MTSPYICSILLNSAAVLLLAAILLTMVRLIKGPTVFDRILSFDGIGVSMIGLLVITSILWNSSQFLDAILVYCIFGFFGTVAFSYYLHLTYELEDSEEGSIND
ncbi:Na(+)/H(+) antiporter subunit F [bacterium]|jgi:multicomponent Na+:H+ antiporter subunit F|nr:Na(+)/H(+) antiporter subunit F [bacterium]